jgi:hypothetical protein
LKTLRDKKEQDDRLQPTRQRSWRTRRGEGPWHDISYWLSHLVLWLA